MTNVQFILWNSEAAGATSETGRLGFQRPTNHNANTKGINMKRTTSGLLAGVACGFLALSLCTASVRAESPGLEVTLAGHDFMRDPANPGLWIGTLKLNIDGVDYEGTGVWWITDLKINQSAFHWFAAGIYDFGDQGQFSRLGSFVLRGRWR